MKTWRFLSRVVPLALALLLGWLIAARTDEKSGPSSPPVPVPPEIVNAERESNQAPSQRPFGTTRNLPRFTTTLPGKIVTTPGAPGYDALKLVNLDVPVIEVFAAEPRNGAWALAMEKRLATQISRDLDASVPDGRVSSSLECRTMTCRLQITAADESHLEKAGTVLDYAPLANSVSYFGGGRGADGRFARTLYLVFDTGTATEPQYATWYARHRGTFFSRLRSLPKTRLDEQPPIPPE
jgi:hypothetical protein